MKELLAILKQGGHILVQQWAENPLDIISIIISGAAVFFAILVPIRIARRQEKISLFEKRFLAYSDFLKLKTFASILNDESYSFRSEDIQAAGGNPEYETAKRIKLVEIEFGGLFNYLPEKHGEAETVQRTIAAVRACEISVHMLPLLYSKKPHKVDVLNEDIKEIFESLDMFMVDLVLQNGSIDDTNRTDFITKVDRFTNQYADLFEAGMQL